MKYLIYGIFAITIVFSIAGVKHVFSTVPTMEAEIEQLKHKVKTNQATINEYKSAMKFENLFMLVASPNNVMAKIPYIRYFILPALPV